MKIQPVSYQIVTPRIDNYKSEAKVITGLQADNFSFKGYSNTLKKMAKAQFKTESDVKKSFSKLMDAILTDKTVSVDKNFSIISNTFKKEGLKGLLKELWMAYPTKQFENMVNASEDKVIVLAHKLNDKVEPEPIVELVNWGRHGFWDALTDNKDAPRKIKLVFANTENGYVAKSNPDKNPDISNMFSVELYLDKKGNLTIEQQHGEYDVTTHFYSSTGHKKFEVERYGNLKPGSTYYNNDGTKAFWKNLFLGGTPTEPIY